MFAEYWPVGASAPDQLALDTGAISKHLMADWVPSLPTQVSRSFVGWPPHLLKAVPYQGLQVLSLVELSGHTERQWKVFLSWMLGIAGTRHVLAAEGYRWVAPLSAFYPNINQPVALPPDWPMAFSPTYLKVKEPRHSLSRLRPDYLAIRSTASETSRVSELAIVESKGTKRRLSKMKKPLPSWKWQAANAELELAGVPITISRRIVVATRVNPNGRRETTRRLQLRAWNERFSRLPPPLEAVVDVVTPHLIGLLRNVGLTATASVLARPRWRERVHGDRRDEQMRVSEQEISRLKEVQWLEIDTDFGPVAIHLMEPLIDLVQSLQRSADPIDAVGAIQAADRQLDRLDLWSATQLTGARQTLPFGVQVAFPERFPHLDRR